MGQVPPTVNTYGIELAEHLGPAESLRNPELFIIAGTEYSDPGEFYPGVPNDHLSLNLMNLALKECYAATVAPKKYDS